MSPTTPVQDVSLVLLPVPQRSPPLPLLLLQRVSKTGNNTLIIISMPGIILSGGYGASTSVEVFVPSTGQSCSLPALPDERYGHTMDSLLICGGGWDSTTAATTCLSFTSGQWITSHTLVEERNYHTSWQTEQGLVLMGGYSSPDTSEILATAGGQGGPSFAMQYSTE
jgi:hypothetical protein